MLEIDVYFAVIFVSSFYKFVNIFKIIFQEFVVINIKTAAFYMGYEMIFAECVVADYEVAEFSFL